MRRLIQLLRWPKPDTDWQWHKTESGVHMRRRIDGKWETREMTPVEQCLTIKALRRGQ